MSSPSHQPGPEVVSCCPEAARLHSFLEGQLSEDQCDTIALHLEGCATCLAAITDLEPNNSQRTPAAPTEEASRLDEESAALERAVARAIGTPLHVAPPPESRFQTGMLVDHYRLVERLGSGGMGVVFLAEHEAMRRRVALKVLTGRLQDDPDSTRRFAHEIRTSAKLIHPRFVKALDAGEFAGSPYLVMEYLDGVSLSALSRGWGSLPVADVCEIGRQIAEGLQVLADNKLVHRDLKPSNVMLVQSVTSSGAEPSELGQAVKILDFGVARWRESTSATQAITLPSFVVGTLEYMAPEQVEASSKVDERADWYSLGATLFKLMLGAAPLELSSLADASPFAKATHLKTESTPAIRSLRRDVPRAVARIVDRLLSRDPAQRPSPSEVQRTFALYAVDADLPRLLRELPEQANPTPITLPCTSSLCLWKRSIQRNTRWFVAAVTLLFGAIVLATNYGELSIDVLDEDTKVVVSRGGKIIEIIDTREKRRVRLHPDKYELTLENSDKHDLVLSTKQVTIRRGTTEIARVKLQPASPPGTSPSLSRAEFLAKTTMGEAGRLSGHKDHVACIAVSKDGTKALSGSESDHALFLWDLRTGLLIRRFEHPRGWVRTVAFSGDGQLALSGGTEPDQALILFRLETGEVVQRLLNHTGAIMSAQFLPDQTQAISAGGSYNGLRADSVIRLWDLKSGEVIRRFSGHEGLIYPIRVSPNGKLLASSSNDGTVRIWRISDAEPLRRWDLDHVIEALDWFPDNRRIVTCSKDRHVLIMDVETGETLKRLGPCPSGIFRAAVSSKGDCVLTSHGREGVVRLWDVELGQILDTFRGNDQETYSVAFAGDDQFALAGGGTGRAGPSADYALRLQRLPTNAAAKKSSATP